MHKQQYLMDTFGLDPKLSGKMTENLHRCSVWIFFTKINAYSKQHLNNMSFPGIEGSSQVTKLLRHQVQECLTVCGLSGLCKIHGQLSRKIYLSRVHEIAMLCSVVYRAAERNWDRQTEPAPLPFSALGNKEATKKDSGSKHTCVGLNRLCCHTALYGHRLYRATLFYWELSLRWCFYTLDCNVTTVLA